MSLHNGKIILVIGSHGLNWPVYARGGCGRSGSLPICSSQLGSLFGWLLSSVLNLICRAFQGCRRIATCCVRIRYLGPLLWLLLLLRLGLGLLVLRLRLRLRLHRLISQNLEQLLLLLVLVLPLLLPGLAQDAVPLGGLFEMTLLPPGTTIVTKSSSGNLLWLRLALLALLFGSPWALVLPPTRRGSGSGGRPGRFGGGGGSAPAPAALRRRRPMGRQVFPGIFIRRDPGPIRRGRCRY